jgi:hypothetical protein
MLYITSNKSEFFNHPYPHKFVTIPNSTTMMSVTVLCKTLIIGNNVHWIWDYENPQCNQTKLMKRLYDFYKTDDIDDNAMIDKLINIIRPDSRSYVGDSNLYWFVILQYITNYTISDLENMPYNCVLLQEV